MITYQDLCDKGPCNAPSLWVSEDWQGELSDLYALPNLEPTNKILMAVWFLSESELRGFALWCAEQSGSAKSARFAESNPYQAAAWFAAKYAVEFGQPIEEQIQYLIDLELSRG